jgi:hypothetical protein
MTKALSAFLLLAGIGFIPSNSLGETTDPITHVFHKGDIFCACVTLPNIPAVTKSLELRTDLTYCSITGILRATDFGDSERIQRVASLPARVAASFTSKKLCSHLVSLVPVSNPR